MTSDKEFVTIKIQDSGLGIPEENLDKIEADMDDHASRL